MYTNALCVFWDRAHPGREKMAAKDFGDFNAYLRELQGEGIIEKYQPVFLDPHGASMNGLFLIHGKPDKLSEIQQTERWTKWVTRGMTDMDGFGITKAATGDAVAERMAIYEDVIAH